MDERFDNLSLNGTYIFAEMPHLFQLEWNGVSLMHSCVIERNHTTLNIIQMSLHIDNSRMSLYQMRNVSSSLNRLTTEMNAKEQRQRQRRWVCHTEFIRKHQDNLFTWFEHITHPPDKGERHLFIESRPMSWFPVFSRLLMPFTSHFVRIRSNNFRCGHC